MKEKLLQREPLMIALAIDLALPQALVAIKNNHSLHWDHFSELRRQAENLLPKIDQLLHQNQLQLTDIHYYILGKGPGSFTSSRLAVTTIQAFSCVNPRPIIALSNLQILAQAAFLQYQIKEVIAVIDAHMDEVYCCEFKCDERNIMQSVVEEKIISYENLIQFLKKAPEKKIVGFGLDKIFNAEFNYLTIELSMHAAALMMLAENATDKKDFIDCQQLEPVYLRGEGAWKKS